ncbi:hypothetical protein BH10ACI2_BH10ACI2_07450 [soil metagenome]
MKRIKKTFTYSMVFVSIVFGMIGIADAQKRSDRDIWDAVRSLNSKIDDFETNFRYQMQSSSSNNGQLSAVADDVRSLRDSVKTFQDYYDKKRENRDDITGIVDAARRIDAFLQSSPQNRRVQDDWDGVHKQIDRLASKYGVTPDWNPRPNTRNMPAPPPTQTGTFTAGLSGTYDLDMARSENVDDIVADTKLGTDQREDLKDKLVAPGQIALDIRGDQITRATSNASPVMFTADGKDKVEQSATGKNVRLRATLNGTTLVVSSLGGETDYTITFTSLSNGKGLKVVRRITTDYLDQTVIAESIYNKTDSVAQLGINANGGSQDASGGNTPSTPGNTTSDPNGGYSDNDQNNTVTNGSSGSNNPNNRNRSNRPGPSTVTAKPGNYTVPNGVVLTGALENAIDTEVSQNNDRFRMTVQSPDEFRGAIVEGYISNVTRSGRVTGQPTVTLNFEKITLRNGQSYDFAANLQSVQTLNGKNYQVDNESTIKGDNQTMQTAKRGGVGGGIGAVIGAIAGGAKGAAIGAIIGAGGGAGTVAAQGKNDVQLQIGSTITVLSSSPMR